MAMMSMQQACVCLVLFVIWSPMSTAFKCVQPTPDPNAPQTPTIPGDSYQAHLELNIVNKNMTMSIEEYLDYEGNRAARMTYTNDGAVKYIYSFDTEEIFTVTGQSCMVVDMNSTEGKSLLSNSPSAPIPGQDRRSEFGAARSFQFDPAKTKYAGLESVRGISAYKWVSCSNTGPQSTMQATYYFNVMDWTMQVSGLSLPLRIEVEGERPSSGGTHYYHHYYDFINYQPYISVDSTMFETPRELICPGRKNTKPLPKIPTMFRYQAESIDPMSSLVQHFEVWYDGLAMMVRIDKGATYGKEQSPVTTNPRTEIHDFNTGIRYVKDRVLGNCSIHPLLGLTPDEVVNSDKSIEMSDPSRLFSLNNNYVYEGTRRVRGIECDIFGTNSTQRLDSGGTTEAIYHYYFLSENWKDLPLNVAAENSMRDPVYLEIEVPQYVGYNRYINFFDFAHSAYDIDAFDVSDCFDNKRKIDLRLVFPGTYYPSTEKQWRLRTFYKMAEATTLSPARIGNLAISSDPENIFVTATLLGTTPGAQFELADGNEIEQIFKTVYKNIRSSELCADLCEHYKDFVCQGYQYCTTNNECSLSEARVLNSTKASIGPKCNYFTRAITKSDETQTSLMDAYNALADVVKTKQFTVLITEPSTFIRNFMAINVQIISGYSDKVAPMPSISSQYSNRVESVVSKYKLVDDSYVWYDRELKYVRMDNRVGQTMEEISQIYDFNRGVTYKINKVTGQCKIEPISPTDTFGVNAIASKPDKNGGQKIQMKTPNEMFYLDDTYEYIGQTTVRGILCDTFQALRSDFHIKNLDLKSERSVFTMHFMAEPWTDYTADSLDRGTAQPVQLTIEDKSAELMVVINFFDWDDEHHNFNYYDMSACYEADQRKSFQIIFKDQPFHPFLDGVEPTFLNTAVLRLGEATYVSPLRFQHVSVDNDDSNVYILATVLGDVPAEYLFQRVSNVTLKPTVDAIDVESYQDCASACQMSKFGSICNSFDYCPNGESSKCYLRSTQAEDINYGQVDPNGTCIHYSRSVKGVFPILSADDLYKTISDVVYLKKFTVTVYLPSGGNKTYIATDIRDDILRSTDPASASGSQLQNFKDIANKMLPDAAVVETHKVTSLTDCALSCVATTSLHCQTFDYNFIFGNCRLSDKHLDELATPLVASTKSKTYTTSYTAEYTKQTGYVFSDNPDITVLNSVSSELCARECNEHQDFKCESFDYCSDRNICHLRKTHSLPGDIPHPGETPKCVHYSRNYLYDYTKHSNSIIDGHDDLTLVVTSDTECARLCASGTLENCASFEVCTAERGDIECKLSQADPTLQHNLTTSSNRGCALYTKSNPSKAIKPQTKTITKTVYVHDKSSSDKSPDTGARVGIAMGTLVLGLFLGVTGMILFSKWRAMKTDGQGDSHQLREYQGDS